jgi:hypothetical protein
MSDNRPLPPVKIAFVIDNEVVDVLHTDARLGAIFLSEPLILDVSDQAEGIAIQGLVGASYDPATGVFTSPETE